jgi:hypothetical protein
MSWIPTDHGFSFYLLIKNQGGKKLSGAHISCPLTYFVQLGPKWSPWANKVSGGPGTAEMDLKGERTPVCSFFNKREELHLLDSR